MTKVEITAIRCPNGCWEWDSSTTNLLYDIATGEPVSIFIAEAEDIRKARKQICNICNSRTLLIASKPYNQD